MGQHASRQLCDAVERNDIKGVAALLDKGTSVKTQEGDGLVCG